MKKFVMILFLVVSCCPALTAFPIATEAEENSYNGEPAPFSSQSPFYKKPAKKTPGRPIFVIRKKPKIWLPWDKANRHSFQLTVKANLLRWATLTPDLGVEYRLCKQIGIGVQASYTSWSWKQNDRKYAVSDIMPHIRWYLGEDHKGYIGAMAQGGSYNYQLKKNAEGIQGDFIGGGIMGGYNLNIGKNLMLDFCIGVGYLYASYEKYIEIFRYEKGKKNYFGPTHLSVNLVYTISFDK